MALILQLYFTKSKAAENAAFQTACKQGNLIDAQQLLTKNPCLNISVDNEKAFRWACRFGHLAVAQQLREWKPTLDIRAENDWAFRMACENGHMAVAQWLHSYRLQITPLLIAGTCSIASADIQECPICYDAQSNVITNCGHQFCQSCVTALENKSKCPYCRAPNITFQQLTSC